MDDVAEFDEVSNADELLALLRAEAGSDGFQRQIDPAHTATFVPRGAQLLVSFEKIADTLALRDSGVPLGLDFAEDKNWSVLHIAAAADSWFRAPELYTFFDELVDEAFFEDFDRVAFYGTGMGGYGAAAFSVVAPGATVLAISPQATLDRDRAGWDNRFPAARRLSFADRYGYAPDMIEGARAAYILFDPHARLDATHASLFQGPNVHRLKCRFLQGHVAWSLHEMGILHRIVEAAAGGTLSDHDFYKLLRARRDHSRFLRNMLFHMDELNDPYLTALYCSHVLSRMSAPAFRRRLNLSIDSLERDGKLPAWLKKKR